MPCPEPLLPCSIHGLWPPPLIDPLLLITTVQGHGDSLGGPEEDKHLVLVLGGHVSLHEHVPAVAAWRAQRRRLLRLPGRAGLQRPQGGHLRQLRER